MSTSCKFRLFSPDKLRDHSSRAVRGSTWVLPPITETGFDQLASRPIEGQTTLDEVVKDRWICSLGRPLFASRYASAGEGSFTQNTIMRFATQKLLAGYDKIITKADDPSLVDRSLACLSIRFPLEFDLSNPNVRPLLRKQIEHHMRLCTIATSGLEVLFSTVGSEPLLAEAAAMAMATTDTSPIRLLWNYMDKNCINHGERGELVAALLVMQARDALTTGEESRRWVRVCDFMHSLLGESARTDVALPSVAVSPEGHQPLAKAFENAYMWFNHVLKVRNFELINARHLWKFISRGAMILCANGQLGVDMVLPVCMGKVLSHRNVTAIVIQVKNDEHFGANIHGHLFDGMDPFAIKLFDQGSPPLPIIRMVFALASKTSAAKYDESDPPRYKHGEFTSYDIWCARTSSDTFPIIDADEAAYRGLLDRTRSLGQEYAVGAIQDVEYPDEVEKAKIALLRNFNPLLETGAEHQLFCEEPPKEQEPGGSSQEKGKEKEGDPKPQKPSPGGSSPEKGKRKQGG